MSSPQHPDHLLTLGRKLRALREQAGLQGKELAERLGWQQSKVSRIELARQNASPADITAWVAATDGTPADRSSLLGLLDQAREDQHTFRQRTHRGQSPVQAGYNALVERSTLIREFHTAIVPGMLQTPDYARAVLTSVSRLNDVPVPDIDDAVATRMARQKFLYEPGRRFEFVIAEPVLRWGLVEPGVMRAQIDRLQSAIGLPTTRLSILPLGTRIEYMPLHMFEMFDDLVCVETTSREHRHTGPEAQTYITVFESMQAAALTGNDARHLLLRIADELA
ncbi:helix-turn-helix transcriptional regulator [Myceligenerans halotolerans]